MLSIEQLLPQIMRYCSDSTVYAMAQIGYVPLLQATAGAAQRHIDRRAIVQRNGAWQSTAQGLPVAAALMAVRSGRDAALGIEAYVAQPHTGQLRLALDDLHKGQLFENSTVAARLWWTATRLPHFLIDRRDYKRWITAWMLTGYLAERRAAWFDAFSACIDYASEPMFEECVKLAVVYAPFRSVDYSLGRTSREATHLGVLSVAKTRVERVFTAGMAHLRECSAQLAQKEPLLGIRMEALKNTQDYARLTHHRGAPKLSAYIDDVMNVVEREAAAMKQTLSSYRPAHWLTDERFERLASTQQGVALLLACKSKYERLAAVLPDVLALLGQ